MTLRRSAQTAPLALQDSTSRATHTILSSDQVSGIKWASSPTRVGMKSHGRQDLDPGSLCHLPYCATCFYTNACRHSKWDAGGFSPYERENSFLTVSHKTGLIIFNHLSHPVILAPFCRQLHSGPPLNCFLSTQGLSWFYFVFPCVGLQLGCFFLLCTPQGTVNAIFSVKLSFLTSLSNVTHIVLVTHSSISAFACLLSRLVVSDSVIPWTAAHQAPLPMEFSRQERILEWAVISFSRGIFLTQGLNPCLLQLLRWQADS